MSKSSTTTRRKLAPIPPGEILLEEFMRPAGISQNLLARSLGVPVSRIAGVVKGERAITADTALRLATFYGTSAEMWLRLQAEFDLRCVEREHGGAIRRVVRPLKDVA